VLKQLSGVDAGFLYMETGSSFGHVSSLSVYGRPYDGYDPYEAFQAQLESRMASLEPFRRRLVEVPFQLDHPYWINDADFDLEFHLRHIAIPPPGDDEQLATQVARIIGRPMDRAHPLWEVYVMEGLPNGDFAILQKVHHATIDGASGAELLTILLDSTPDGTPVVEVDDWKPDAVPSPFELLTRSMVNLARRPDRVMRMQARALRQIAQTTRSKGLRRVLELSRRTTPRPPRTDRPSEPDRPPILPSAAAPPTPFNRSITAHRRFAFSSVPLDDVKAVKNALGATLNDVVMAVCAGALRTYLQSHDALPDAPLVAMVPVSIRTGDEEDRWTNRVSGLLAPLPTNVADPVERVRVVHETMLGAKERFELIPADVLTDFARFSPPALATRAARMASRLRIADRINPPVNLVISNVPGPRHPLYLAGARLKHYYPVSTVTDGQGLNITVQSYLDTLDFGLVSSRELVPDLWDLVILCVQEVAVLTEATRPSTHTTPGRSPSGAPKTRPRRRSS
jgi:diacylglycerol O-acyltransferase / wax synthase